MTPKYINVIEFLIQLNTEQIHTLAHVVLKNNKNQERPKNEDKQERPKNVLMKS